MHINEGELDIRIFWFWSCNYIGFAQTVLGARGKCFRAPYENLPLVGYSQKVDFFTKKRRNMSSRGSEYKSHKKDKFGNVVPEVEIPKIYQKNYKHQRNKGNRFGR